jgi:hypothetical protein
MVARRVCVSIVHRNADTITFTRDVEQVTLQG